MGKKGEYEFDAPKYCDFSLQQGGTANAELDAWFDDKPQSPLSMHEDSDSDGTAKGDETPKNIKQRLRRSTITKNSQQRINNLSQKLVQAAKKQPPTKAKAQRTSLKYMPTRSVKPLTIPKDFNFSRPVTRKSKTETSATLHQKQPLPKTHNIPIKKPIPRAVKNPPVVSKVIKKVAPKKIVPPKKKVALPKDLTLSEPFHFHEAIKKFGNDIKEPKSPFKSLAVKVQEFQDEIPDRFKAKPSKLAKSHHIVHQLTQPKSPFLSTKLRNKPPRFLPTEEMKIKEVEAMEPFKANPVDRKILETDRPLGVPAIKKIQATIPSSPAITKPLPKPIPQEPKHIFKANPIKIGKVFQPVYEHKHTESLDIHLHGEEIRKQKLEAFEAEVKRQRFLEAGQRKFIANPLPSGSPDKFPVKPVHITESKPFNLQTDARGEIHERKFNETIQLESIQLENQKKFKANPLPSNTAPFIPKKSTKPPTDPEDLILNSQIRAEERRKFEEALKLKENQEKEIKKMVELDNQIKEKQSVRQLRSRLVHHANPVRHFANTIVQPSSKKLTEAMSPMIGEKRKRMMAERSESKYGGK